MKKYLSVVLGIFLVLSALFISKAYLKKSVAPTPKPTVKIKVAFIANSMSELPVAVAMKNGYFEKYGLEVESIKTTNATNNSKTFISGGSDLAMGYPTAYMLAAAEGANIKFIGVVNYNNPFVFVSRVNAVNIKNIGVTNKTGETYNATLAFLKSLNIDPQNVNFTVLGSQDLVGKALVAGSIDGAVYPDSVWAMFKDRSKIGDELKIIAKTADKDKKISGIFVKGETLLNKKDVIENFSKAMLEANYWIRTNSVEAITAEVAGVNKISKDDAPYLAKFGKEAVNGVLFTPDPALIEKVRKGLEEQSPKMKAYKAVDFVSFEISDLLKKAGLLSQYGF